MHRKGAKNKDFHALKKSNMKGHFIHCSVKPRKLHKSLPLKMNPDRLKTGNDEIQF